MEKYTIYGMELQWNVPKFCFGTTVDPVEAKEMKFEMRVCKIESASWDFGNEIGNLD